jgi:hypothetical protein
MYDAEAQMLNVVMHKAIEQSQGCERGIIAITLDGRGMAIIAPNCVLYSQIFHPEVKPFDLCLN